MPLLPGQLDSQRARALRDLTGLCDVLRYSEVIDTSGERTQVWQPVYVGVPCRLVDTASITGRERLRLDAVAQVTQWMLILPWDVEVSSKDRIRFITLDAAEAQYVAPAINEVHNPSAETGLTYWSPATLTQAQGPTGYVGSKSIMGTIGATLTGVPFISSPLSNVAPGRIDAQAGEQWSFGVRVKGSRVGTLVQMQVAYRNASNVATRNDFSSTNPDTGTTSSVTAPSLAHVVTDPDEWLTIKMQNRPAAPANTVYAVVLLIVRTIAPSLAITGDTAQFDAVQASRTPVLPDYFDGSFEPELFYSWEGAAHASRSIRAAHWLAETPERSFDVSQVLGPHTDHVRLRCMLDEVT